MRSSIISSDICIKVYKQSLIVMLKTNECKFQYHEIEDIDRAIAILKTSECKFQYDEIEGIDQAGDMVILKLKKGILAKHNYYIPIPPSAFNKIKPEAFIALIKEYQQNNAVETGNKSTGNYLKVSARLTTSFNPQN